MKEALLGKLVMVLSRATPEELAATYRFATGEPLESTEAELGKGDYETTDHGPLTTDYKTTDYGLQDHGTRRENAETLIRWNGQTKLLYVFRWTGRDWEVVFGGGRAFHVPNVLGARYLNYHLHRPNQPISAFDLEVAVWPEKGEVRARNSIQPESDARALAQYREELRQLQAKRKELEAAGDADALKRLDSDVAALETALTASDRAADTGRRAFDNVRKAVGTVRKHLRQGGREERAFEEYLRSQLSIGHECMYTAPEGRVWI